MNALKDIQGVIFDYGGTIDTNSRHWAEVLWAKYVEHQIPVDKESFREAYDDQMDYYNNDRYQWDLLKLSPREYYGYLTTGIYPLQLCTAGN